MENRKYLLKICLILMLSVIIIFSSYTVNFVAKADEPVNLSLENNLVIITKDSVNLEKKLNKIIKNNTDFKKVQNQIDNRMNINVVKSTENIKFNNLTTVAANVSEVKENNSYKNFLKKELKNGKRVILFGDVQPEEYKEILALDELSVKDKQGIKLQFGLTEDEVNYMLIENKKPKITDKEFFESVDSKFTNHVISYTLDNNKELQFIDVSINNFDEDGSPIPNTNEIILQEVLDTQSEITNAENNKYQEEKETFSFLTKNTASAENVRILDKYNIVQKGYCLGALVARMDTDYHLYKQNSDQNKKYDYFTLKPITQITSYKGLWARSLFVDIDIPADSDHLDTWSPQGDKGGSSFGISLAFPYSISFNMDFSESLRIDDRSSLGYDYARWNLTDNSTDLVRNISGNTFSSVAGWASTGSYATAGLTVRGEFDNYITLTTKTKVAYDY